MRIIMYARVAIIAALMPLLTGCWGGWGCDDCGRSSTNARPVYMDFNTLRASVEVGEPRALTDISRVYVYQNVVFLNSRNQGVHVIDNSDKSNPRNAAFIEVPGNTEISIKDNAMYLDSYVDLVTLDISNPDNVFESDRERDIFPYDAYQNIPDDVYFGYDGVDENRGVVVSYERI